MTPFALTAGRNVRPRQVHWIRHRTARSLVRAYFSGADADDITDEKGIPVLSSRGFLGEVKALEMWAFCIPVEGIPPIVHYWASPAAKPLELIFLLGHEIGHASGRPLTSARNLWREELRADEYGSCAAAVMTHLQRRERATRRRRPTASRRRSGTSAGSPQR